MPTLRQSLCGRVGGIPCVVVDRANVDFWSRAWLPLYLSPLLPRLCFTCPSPPGGATPDEPARSLGPVPRRPFGLRDLAFDEGPNIVCHSLLPLDVGVDTVGQVQFGIESHPLE